MNFREFYKEFKDVSMNGVFDFRNLGVNLIGLSVAKRDVRRLDLKVIREGLKFARRNGKDMRHSLMVTFDGYDDDRSEIYEIQEIRSYVRKIFNEFPYIFYYLTDIGNNQGVILACLCDTVSSLKQLPEGQYSISELIDRGYEPFLNMPKVNVHFEISGAIRKKLISKVIDEAKRNQDPKINTIHNMFLKLGLA